MDISHKFIGMEGLMEKLPMNKKKATLLKTWKRRFFRAADGWLHYYEVLYKLNKAGYQQTCDRFVLVCLFIYMQSTLVISKSKGLSETLGDIRTSTYQICRIEETTNPITKFHK